MGATSNRAIKLGVERAAKKAEYSPLVETMTRLGYGVRGFIYITIGLLAFDVIYGKGGTPADPQGAIAAIGRQPAGVVLLWVVLVGLVSYSLWGLIRAVLDPLHKGHDLKGFLTRVGYLFSATGYALLAPYTYGLIKGSGSAASSGANPQQFMASIMAMPWGRWAAGLIGLAVLAVGLYQIYQGLNASFDKQFKIYAMTAREVKWAIQLGRFGTAARGVVFGLVGILISLAAYNFNPRQPIGIDAALKTLLALPYGILLLGIIAMGLISFGAYSMLSAVWFRLKR